MSPRLAKSLKVAAAAVAVLGVLGVTAGGWFYTRMKASLPQLDGSAKVSGLSAGVTVERDGLGVPTIRGANRVDVARALGWVHAQERFFQMDLMRRRAAGELAELVGPAALKADKAARMHGFRLLARGAVVRATAAEREVVEAYTAGVNAGLSALGEKPFEYLALRVAPQPWRAEDCGLVSFAITLDMQPDPVGYERMLGTLRETLGAEAVAFFAPLIGPRDAALDGSTAPLPKIPPAQAINLRRTGAPGPAKVSGFGSGDSERELPGSNAFALAGAHTASGVAMLANDMHLRLGLPNTWYRAALAWTDGETERRVVGATLPGVPCLIVGSNGRVAWGLTAAQIDTCDLVVVQTGISPELYRVPGNEELARIEVRRETIAVKGAESVVMEYRWTVWGPIVGADEKDRPIAQRWIAHEPEAINFGLFGLESAANAAAAVAVAQRAGVTSLNIVIADAAGEIAWTLAGRVPKRVGVDGRFPAIWTFGDRRWDGMLAPDEVPVVRASANGRLWSANHRMVGGAAGAKLGDGGHDLPMRAAQIREALAGLERAEPKDLLTVQLDDRALALARWRERLLRALSPEVVAGKPERAEMRARVEGWSARATTDDVGYRLVRGWRDAVARRVFDPIFAPCVAANEKFNWGRLPFEEPLWMLLEQKPAHLLSPRETSWEALLVAAADEVVAGLEQSGTSLAQATWGRKNVARIEHPLVQAVPAWVPGGLTAWLRTAGDELPGDRDMPRVQRPNYGASERLVVSPGREAEGIFQMPGGQSGHPLSPFFRAGHNAWVRGEATPLLPGKTAHTVTLRP
jgi:penicillin amidase